MSDDKTVVPGFIRGYRLWNSRTSWQEGEATNYLYGVAHQLPWNYEGPMEAKCGFGDRRPSHSSPDSSCRCGLYAMYEPVGLMQPPTRVPGIIDAWGTTILGTTGFRAQKAVIRALWQSGFSMKGDAIQAAGDFYGVPVFENRTEAVEAFPPTDVSELVDTKPREQSWVGNHAAVMAIDLGKVSASVRSAREKAQDLTDAMERMLKASYTFQFHGVDPEIIDIINGKDAQ